jgi:hypothetical protein
MATQLTTEQEKSKLKFEQFFMDENTTTVCGKLIDKSTLSITVDIDGNMMARAVVKNADPVVRSSPFVNKNMQAFLIKKPVTLSKADPANVLTTWNMRGVCVGNSSLNLVNVVS